MVDCCKVTYTNYTTADTIQIYAKQIRAHVARLHIARLLSQNFGISMTLSIMCYTCITTKA